MSEVPVISNKEIFEKMVERDLNNIISQIDNFFYNFSDSIKNINSNAFMFASLVEPMIKPKYFEIRNKYLPIIVGYVDSAIDISFPTGKNISIEEGNKIFNDTMSGYLTPIINAQIDKLNLSPTIVEIASGIFQGVQQKFPQYFK